MRIFEEDYFGDWCDFSEFLFTKLMFLMIDVDKDNSIIGATCEDDLFEIMKVHDQEEKLVVIRFIHDKCILLKDRETNRYFINPLLIVGDDRLSEKVYRMFEPVMDIPFMVKEEIEEIFKSERIINK